MMGDKFPRRDFLKAGGVSALGTQMTLSGGACLGPGVGAFEAADMKRDFPSSRSLLEYSPQKLAFAASTDYQGVVIIRSIASFNPRLSDTQIDQVLANAREANIRIISIECMDP